MKDYSEQDQEATPATTSVIVKGAYAVADHTVTIEASEKKIEDLHRRSKLDLAHVGTNSEVGSPLSGPETAAVLDSYISDDEALSVRL